MYSVNQLSNVRLRPLLILLSDLIAIPLAWYGAYWLRFNLASIPPAMLTQATSLLPLVLLIQGLIFWQFSLYRGLWKFASLYDLFRILKAVIVATVAIFCLICLWQYGRFFGLRLELVHGHIPRSILPLYFWLLVSLLSGSRLFYRWWKAYSTVIFGQNSKRVLLIGAGQAADLFLRELMKTAATNNYQIVAIADDDRRKQGFELHGIRVVGNLQMIPELLIKYNINLVIMAIPTAPASLVQQVVNHTKLANCEFLLIPPLTALLQNQTTVTALRKVSLEDLLGRTPITLDWPAIIQVLTKQSIIVTGGGGSIGSELCRQIALAAATSIQQLIIIDHSEYNLYQIDRELRERFPQLPLACHLINIVDEVAIEILIQHYRPSIIFHAAAYKHVPLLETEARAAIQNNILGSYVVATAALRNRVATFVLISTDKAVKPVNILGATKRVAEMICQSLQTQQVTNFVTVRFGNVLGSAGSVVPLFTEQLAAGKPLTVTHPEMTRYFMTIPEATQLILQSVVLSDAGGIFVLDMGKPVKIKMLAEQLISLTQNNPMTIDYTSSSAAGIAIESVTHHSKNMASIVYTGLRPGEKLTEELFYDSETLIPTNNPKIYQANYSLLDREQLEVNLQQLFSLLKRMDNNPITEKAAYQQILKAIVQEYVQTEER